MLRHPQITLIAVLALVLVSGCGPLESGIDCGEGCEPGEEQGLPEPLRGIGVEHPDQVELLEPHLTRGFVDQVTDPGPGSEPTEEPPVEQPPVEQPPVEEPPGEEPPVEEPPVEEPPVEEPPVEEPPVEEPPVEEPPVEEPPAEEPPVEEPPAEEPPVVPDNCQQVRVVNTGGSTLNVRPQPSTNQAAVGALESGQTVDVLAIVDGQSIEGDRTWYEIRDGGLEGYVSGAYADCVDPDAAPLPGFFLPFNCGKTVKVTQGNNSNFSHQGMSAYAFDFGIPVNTVIRAAKAGFVHTRRMVTRPGDSCYDGGGSSCANAANVVVIEHPGGTRTTYAHVNSIPVQQGQQVERGQKIALSGNTGYSTGPHLHMARTQGCSSWWCQSISMKFKDVPGDGVPVSGEWVTSQNNCQ